MTVVVKTDEEYIAEFEDQSSVHCAYPGCKATMLLAGAYVVDHYQVESLKTIKPANLTASMLDGANACFCDQHKRFVLKSGGKVWHMKQTTTFSVNNRRRRDESVAKAEAERIELEEAEDDLLSNFTFGDPDNHDDGSMPAVLRRLSPEGRSAATGT